MLSPRDVIRVPLMALVLVATARPMTAAPLRYTLQDLGVVQDSVSTLSATGASTGTLGHGDQEEAVRLQAGQAPQRLGFPPQAETSHARGIGADGAIVGSTTRRGQRAFQGFLWTEAQGMHALVSRGIDGGPGEALGLNTVQVIVGYDLRAPSLNLIRPVVWVAGQAAHLETLGEHNAVAHAVNEQGDIVGDAVPPGGTMYHATLWPLEGGLVDLQTVPATFSNANAISLDRQVVGTVCLAPACRGFLWTAQAGMTLLPLLAGDASSVATGINDAGLIVGTETAADGMTRRGVLWEHGTPIDLSTRVDAPGWTLSSASGINAQGQILGGAVLGGVSHLILLTPAVLTVAAAPVPLVVTVRGDFNGDGWQDQAGLTADGAIWLGLAGAAWHEVGGRLQILLAGDLTGEGRDALVGGIAGTVWTMTDGIHWQQQPTPGPLRTLVLGNFYGEGRQHLAGLTDEGRIWRSPVVGQWEEIGGRLATLVSCDLNGDGVDDLAGLATNGSIWVNLTRWAWGPWPANSPIWKASGSPVA